MIEALSLFDPTHKIEITCGDQKVQVRYIEQALAVAKDNTVSFNVNIVTEEKI